jgi:predicted ATP-dependent serine protease
MARFEVLANGVVVGHSDLEGGDPPMGVASGLLRTTPEYAAIRSTVTQSAGGLVQGIKLVVRERNGAEIPAQGGVTIEDHSEDLANVSAVEVSVLGVPYPLYEQLFPAHVAAYKKRFG